MKRFNYSKNSIALIVFAAAIILGGSMNAAEFNFGNSVNHGPNINSSCADFYPVVSPDGCTIYFSSDRLGCYGGFDIYVATRESKDDEWGPIVHLIWPVNTPNYEMPSSISADGLSLYLYSNRAGGKGGFDLWVTTRETTSSPWGTPVNLGATLNRSSNQINPVISSDGLSLYYSSNQTSQGGFGGYDLWVTTRETTSSSWGTPVNLGEVVNSPVGDYHPSISTDGLALFFASNRTGGYGTVDIYVTTKASISDPWGTPVNLGPKINTPSEDDAPWISVDGSTLYFTSTGHGGYGSSDIFEAPIYDVPTCGDFNHPCPTGDFNMDCRVNENDFTLFYEHLGECTAPECDDTTYPPDIPGPLESNAVGSVDINTVFQELEGFGASVAWYENWLVVHPLRNEIYDLLFGQLDLDIYRLRNTYGLSSGNVDNSATIIEAAELSLGHPLKIMISSWSPPASLKNNNSTVKGTLIKGRSGGYAYENFAQWWRNSLEEYAAHGIIADYINIQNEPDYLGDWDTCMFTPTESEEWAGYNLAFEAVYQELNSHTIVMPKMLAPEASGFRTSQAYIDTLINPEHVYGYAHHLYADGKPEYPDNFIPGMEYFGEYSDKPLLQTEYAKDTSEPLTYSDAMDLALLIHNSLTVEGVSAYLYWQLFWEKPQGLVSLDNPWESNPGYTINPDYYAFKQYSAFTDPGWHRVEASTDSTGLRISAFISPDENELTIVIINVSNIDIDLSLSLGDFLPDSSAVYRTSESEHTASIGAFDQSQPLELPSQTITTVKLTGSCLP